jgi:hypothetical protein
VTGSTKLRGWSARLAQAKLRPYLQNNQSKRAGGVAQVAQGLPIKYEALKLNTRIPKTKQKKKHM